MRGMSYNIMNKELNIPLCWDEQALDFETEDAAKEFAEYCGIVIGEEAEIKPQILFYDGGYINGEEILKGLKEGTLSIWEWEDATNERA